MRFFKYLIIHLILFFSSFSHAQNKVIYYSADFPKESFYTEQAACDNLKNKYGISYPSVKLTGNECAVYSNTSVHKYVKIYYRTEDCPSAIQQAISVSRNSGSYVCVAQCQYAIQGCVEVNFDSGNPDGGDRSKMSCNAISTGKSCAGATNPNTGNTSQSPTTSNPGANANNDGSKTATNSSNSTTTGSETSNSTSTTTTTNNTTNNTSTSTTNTTTTTTVNNTTNTVIDLSSLENTIVNTSKTIVDAVNKLSGKIDGGNNGSENGTDLTETNKKLDEINSNTKGTKDSLDAIKKELTTDPGLGDGTGIVDIGQQQIDIPDQQYFQWSAQCPLSTGSTAISLNGQATSIDSDFTSWCKMAVDVRPFVLAAGAVIAFLIASGVWMGRGE